LKHDAQSTQEIKLSEQQRLRTSLYYVG
jgi:hypothetical protein